MKRLLRHLGVLGVSVLGVNLAVVFSSQAQLEVVPADQPPAVFAGKAVAIQVQFRNPTDAAVDKEISTRLFQASAATLAPLGEPQPWKKLRVLPKQTVVESFAVTFPEIRAPSRFRIQWSDLGRTDVLVYPPDLLKQLQTLAGELPLVVLDPDNKLRAVLKDAGIRFVDYEVEKPECKLAIIWSTAASLPDSIQSRVKKGLSAVWIRPQKLTVPYAVRVELGTVVVVPQSAVAAVADSPLAQLNLIRLAELALQPEALRLPDPNQQPERN